MEINCKNCQTLFKGNFCPNCGQRVISKRFTVKDSVSWLFSSIFNLEKGFLYTAKQMLLYPGKVVQEYTSGITVRYAHPFRFLFVLATISTLIGVYTHAYEEMGRIGSELNQDQSAAQLEFGRKWSSVMGQYMSFIIMGMIPFYSMGTALFYRSRKKFFAEHLIMNSYANGVSIMIGLPFMFLYPLLGGGSSSWLTLVSMLIGLVVMSRTYSQYFKENVVVSALKYIAIFFLVIVLSMILGIIATIIYFIIAKIFGIETVFDTVKAAQEGAAAL